MTRGGKRGKPRGIAGDLSGKEGELEISDHLLSHAVPIDGVKRALSDVFVQVLGEVF